MDRGGGRRMSAARSPVRLLLHLWRILWFSGFFLRELVAANLRVAWEVVTPTHYMRAGIVKIPTRARSDLELVLYANLISLTPGTLTLEVDEQREHLYVHTLYVPSREQFVDRMADFENRLLRALR
jgi:multicomponent Na+:H+ antiporter subunit E